MNRLRKFLFALGLSSCYLPAMAADVCKQTSLKGDRLTKLEQLKFESVSKGLKCHDVIRKDINGDGTIDYLLFNESDEFLVFITDPKNTDIANARPIFFVLRGLAKPAVGCEERQCRPELTLVPSVLQAGYDSILRTSKGCALIRGSNAPWRHQPAYKVEVELFDCQKFDNKAYITTQIDCIANGGRWEAPARLGGYRVGTCFVPITDAGKLCKSDKDCQKACYYKGPPTPSNEEIVGTCSEYESCATSIIDGKRLLHACVE